MNEKPPFDPERTNPDIRLEELEKTQEFRPPTKSVGDPEMGAMLERVQQQDEQLRQEFAEALSGVMGRQAKVLDFKWLKDRTFEVTFEAEGKAATAVIQQPEPLQGE